MDSLENQYDNDKFIDYYKTLDINMDAGFDEIKKKYLELAKKYHPDQKTGNSEIFQQISKAYEVLSNKKTRKEYDLYFLKKNFGELEEETFLSMKDQFNDFIVSTDNKNKITPDELNKMYDDIFNKDRDNFKEIKMDEKDISNRINDINFELETINIETNNEQFKEIIANNPELQVGKVLEYISAINTDAKKEIVNKEFGTLDTLANSFTWNYSFLTNTNVSSEFSTISDDNLKNANELTKKFDVTNYNEWKQNRKPDSKLDSSDIDLYLSRRKQEENELFDEVENTLVSDVKKRIDVETFLKKKNHINNDDMVKVETISNVKKRNVI
jgi:curved DNA-binding protein CbpA